MMLLLMYHPSPSQKHLLLVQHDPTGQSQGRDHWTGSISRPRTSSWYVLLSADRCAHLGKTSATDAISHDVCAVRSSTGFARLSWFQFRLAQQRGGLIADLRELSQCQIGFLHPRLLLPLSQEHIGSGGCHRQCVDGDNTPRRC